MTASALRTAIVAPIVTAATAALGVGLTVMLWSLVFRSLDVFAVIGSAVRLY